MPALEACPTGLNGPEMALLRVGDGGFCIDATEVTQADYAQFLMAEVQLSEQPHALCDRAQNPTFEPYSVNPTTGLSCQADRYTPGSTPNLPVVCIDFCDAIAYCHWAGKRLCGLSQQPGETFGSWRDDTSVYSSVHAGTLQSQWFLACSGQEEAEPPLMDLNGTVAQWEDVCSNDGYCLVRGSRFEGTPEDLECGNPAPGGTDCARVLDWLSLLLRFAKLTGRWLRPERPCRPC